MLGSVLGTFRKPNKEEKLRKLLTVVRLVCALWDDIRSNFLKWKCRFMSFYVLFTNENVKNDLFSFS